MGNHVDRTRLIGRLVFSRFFARQSVEMNRI
jgi:hypothetical protein